MRIRLWLALANGQVTGAEEVPARTPPAAPPAAGAPYADTLGDRVAGLW